MNIFSFFAGAGFLDLGFEMTGHYNIVYVNEFHKAFNDIYRFSRERMGIPPPIYGHHVEDITSLLNDDKLNLIIEQINESKRQTLTGIIGGPPCPDFSIAGKNRGKDGDNGKLSGVYIDIICKSQPDFFLFENVKGLYQTTRHRDFFEYLKKKVINSGYFLTEQLINALEFGVPQERERIILIGVRRNVAELHELYVVDDKLANFPWDKYKLYSKEYIYSCTWPTQTPYIGENKDFPQPNGIIKELTVGYWWEKNDVDNHPNQNMYFRPRAGLRKFQTIEEGDDKKKCFKRLHRWRFSPTAAYGNNEVHIHPYKPRRISIPEALAIQSLPMDFILPDKISLSDAFKTISNGVPYLVAKGLAQSLYDCLK